MHFFYKKISQSEPARLVLVPDHDADSAHGDHGEHRPEASLHLAHPNKS